MYTLGIRPGILEAALLVEQTRSEDGPGPGLGQMGPGTVIPVLCIYSCEHDHNVIKFSILFQNIPYMDGLGCMICMMYSNR